MAVVLYASTSLVRLTRASSDASPASATTVSWRHSKAFSASNDGAPWNGGSAAASIGGRGVWCLLGLGHPTNPTDSNWTQVIPQRNSGIEYSPPHTPVHTPTLTTRTTLILGSYLPLQLKPGGVYIK